MKKQFDFRKMSLYQIWIRSFADGNGDGIGDLYGVYDKLDYIKSLGVDGIWFSPIYPSPNADYGYDISDYRNVHPDYGTLDQFQKVLEKAHALGLKVIMDLVVNHTSDEHAWFVESCKGKDNPYSDYYIWRNPKWKDGKMYPPNNWYSLFEGCAWEYNENRKQYYLHIFAKKQPDLNMDNPKVREEVKEIMRFWLDMGVDGFREDVITFISKHEMLPDGNPLLMTANGMKYYKDGPNLITYLKEFRKIALEYGAIQIGEAPMTPVKTALGYIKGKNRLLDMMIQFDTMTADCFMTEYIHLPFSLRRYKRACTRWQKTLAGKAWNTLYIENHDHPRVINRYGSLEYWKESGKMLAACYLFQQGTPFIYQGQEIGMTNIELPSIDDYLDVVSKNNYNTLFTWESEKKRLHRVHVSSRDSARTPVQWDSSENAGFTTGTPWFGVNPNYPDINVEKEEKDPDSILNFYRKCLALRKSSKTLLFGTYKLHAPFSRKLFAYERVYKGERIFVLCSFTKKPISYRLPDGLISEQGEMLICNYPGEREAGKLQPYEVQVWRFKYIR